MCIRSPRLEPQSSHLSTSGESRQIENGQFTVRGVPRVCRSHCPCVRHSAPGARHSYGSGTTEAQRGSPMAVQSTARRQGILRFATHYPGTRRAAVVSRVLAVKVHSAAPCRADGGTSGPECLPRNPPPAGRGRWTRRSASSPMENDGRTRPGRGSSRNRPRRCSRERIVSRKPGECRGRPSISGREGSTTKRVPAQAGRPVQPLLQQGPDDARTAGDALRTGSRFAMRRRPTLPWNRPTIMPMSR